jgi:predicted nucleotide-binding protein with TIR-like domain
MTKNSGQAVARARARAYLSQADVPGVSLQKALRIPTAIGDNYGYKPSSPLQVAKALDMQPSSGPFRTLTGAAIAYGLTTGGYNADVVSITPLGLRIVRPTKEGDDLTAKREALLRPRVIREFLQKYDRAPVPKESIAQNVLLELGVPDERTPDVLAMILESAEAVGFLQDIKDRKYVELAETRTSADEPTDPDGNHLEPEAQSNILHTAQPGPSLVSKPLPATISPDSRTKRVFITHGRNRGLIEPIKKLLSFGELEAVVSVQTQTVSQSVPGKVMEEMRSCGAAIIHVEDERHLVDKEGTEHVVLNDNVLIEIGAAIALYGSRFILVVKEGVKLPSNLQGLLELRYKGATLDVNDTVNLVDAINDMKKRPLP